MDTKFTVYKTSNLINARYYIGVHKTAEPNDSYLGSGKLITRAIAKYGEENFKKEILFAYETEQEAFAKEFELVEAAKSDKLCYNLRQGGSGGFDWINRKKENQDWRQRTAEITNELVRTSPDLIQKRATNARNGREKLARLLKEDPIFRNSFIVKLIKSQSYWIGRKHSIKTKRRMSVSGQKATGTRNSQFGTCWITKEGTNRKIKLQSLAEFEALGWLKGRKQV